MAAKHDILIVDDEPMVLAFLKDLLGSYSDRFNVHTAMSAEEALRILETHQISLLTTDICMPEMDGFELILQARKKNPDTRFIVMTAHGSDESFEKSMECGAVGFLKKPFTLDRFIQNLFRALQPVQGFRAAGFHGFHLTDALQLMHMAGKSQTICVRTEIGDETLIYLRDGEVVHAESKNLKGEEAFYKVVSLEGGEIESLPLPDDTPVTINRPLAALILEGARRKDEREASKDDTESPLSTDSG
jgi:CheY-like chemotaxis protein